MSVVIPNTFAATTVARASEVNANFQALAAKFTEGAGGIKDEDISTAAGIKRTKLSTVVGNRITEAQLEDDAVDLRVLKDDATPGAPNAAVNNANHIKDAIITNAKMVAGTLKKGSLALASVLVAIPAHSSPFELNKTTDSTLLSSSAFPIAWHGESATPTSTVGTMIVNLHLDTATGKYWVLTRISDPVTSAAGFNLRIWYIQVT